jgi:hypothetical protein
MRDGADAEPPSITEASPIAASLEAVPGACE